MNTCVVKRYDWLSGETMEGKHTIKSGVRIYLEQYLCDIQMKGTSVTSARMIDDIRE